jgi:hypothetical protein
MPKPNEKPQMQPKQENCSNEPLATLPPSSQLEMIEAGWIDRQGRLSQDFLDLLNGESAKMSAALQNPANWPAIQQAAREAPAKIAELEREMGLKEPAGKIGPMEAISRQEVERMLDERLGKRIEVQPREVKLEVFEGGKDKPLSRWQRFKGWIRSWFNG